MIALESLLASHDPNCVASAFRSWLENYRDADNGEDMVKVGILETIKEWLTDGTSTCQCSSLTI